MSLAKRLYGEARHRKPREQREADDPILRRDFPLLHEVLTTCRFEGKDIKPFTLSFYCHAGRFSLCLSDRENSRAAFITLKTPTELLGAAEKALEAFDELDWRDDRDVKSKRA